MILRLSVTFDIFAGGCSILLFNNLSLVEVNDKLIWKTIILLWLSWKSTALWVFTRDNEVSVNTGGACYSKRGSFGYGSLKTP